MAVVAAVFDQEEEIDDVPVLERVLVAVLLRVCVGVIAPVRVPDTDAVPDTEDVCVLVLV